MRLDSEEQAKIAKAGLEMKLITSEMDAETEKWQESGSALEENNDIVKRAKNMSSMAFSMYQFTRGEGALKTTQDLFTQAEYFAEEANRLYKVVRQFSYQVRGDRLAYRRRSKRDDTSFFNWTDVDILIYISPLLLWSFFYHCLLYGLYIGLDSAFLDPRYIGNLFTYAIEFRFFVSRNVEAASSLQRESIPFLIHAIMKYSLVDANNYCYFNNIQSKNFHRT